MLGMRYYNLKILFMEQRLQGTLGVWAEPFVRLRLPKIFNSAPTRTSSRPSPRTRTTTG
jgi:hypothetical protein